MQAIADYLECGKNDYGIVIFSPKQSDIKFDVYKTNLKRVLVMDSSYNPPTRAHVQLCLSAISQHTKLDIDTLVMLLATKNADKQQSTIDDYVNRMELMKTVALDELSIDGVETLIAATSASLFRDKAQLLKQYLGKDDCQLYFVLGYDTAIRLFDMKYYPESKCIQEALLSLFSTGVHLLIAARSHDSHLMEQFMRDVIYSNAEWSSLVHLIEMPPEYVDISSTRVRQCLQNGNHDELKQLVPQSIIDKLLSGKKQPS